MTPLRIPSPTVLLRDPLSDPRAPAVAAFVIAGVALGIAGWRVLRNLRHNEPGLTSPVAFALALVIALAGFFGAQSLAGTERWGGNRRPSLGCCRPVFLCRPASVCSRFEGPIGRGSVGNRALFRSFSVDARQGQSALFHHGRYGLGQDDGDERPAHGPDAARSPARGHRHGEQGRRVVFPGVARKEVRPVARHNPTPVKNGGGCPRPALAAL